VRWADFREFLAAVERRGDLQVVEGASCDLEIGALTELMAERGGPLLLFDRIPGFAPGYRIAAKPYTTTARTAIALGLPEDASPFELFKLWRDKVHRYEPIPPAEVASGPVMQNVLEGDAVDLTRFPTPRWHEHDGGAYFGTGCVVITRDPDDGWINLGTYRCMLHDARTTGLEIAPYHHGNLHLRKWWAQGRSAPVAVAVSPDPSLFWSSTEGLPWGASELEYAGFLRGAPVEVLRGPHSGLPLPANAELILEGEVPPPDVEQRPEGPFGEYTGYYAGGVKLQPVIRVRAVYHRSDPILHGDPPLKPPVLTLVCPPARSALNVWNGLERSGLPGVKGVYPLNVGSTHITVVAIQQQYAGHARQVGRVASGLMHSICRLMIVVDDDVDPSDPEAVLWAVATRSDPVDSFEVQPECPASSLDAMIPPARKRAGIRTSARGLIVACRPWEWQDAFPPVNRASAALRQGTLAKWEHLFT
jgi:UbiD family decarboxylase